MQQVAVMRLGNIGYVETLQAVRLIEVEPPKVKDMLYVLHAVDVSVHVYIAVASLYDAAAFSAVLREFHTLERLNRARLVGLNILRDDAVALSKYIYRLACVGVDHRPDAASVSVALAALVAYSVVATREELHNILHPGVNRNAVVGYRHLIEFHDKARKHPCLMHRIEIVHAVTTLVAMEVGCIQQVIAKMTKEYMIGKIAVERFHKEVVASYLT